MSQISSSSFKFYYFDFFFGNAINGIKGETEEERDANYERE